MADEVHEHGLGEAEEVELPAGIAAGTPPPPDDDAPQHEHDRWWMEHVYTADSVPQLTARALITGCIIGGVMSFSNLYVGLKTGWGLGASITAAILAYAFFTVWQTITGSEKEFTVLENNTMQTAASSAAYMTSAGLVAAIPALYMVMKDKGGIPPLYAEYANGIRIDLLMAMPWLIGVCLVGVVAAIPVKRRLINQERLRFPSGVACAETLRGLHASGKEGMQKAWALFISGGLAAVLALLKDGFGVIPGHLAIFGDALAKKTVSFGMEIWTLGAGAIMGIRVTLTMTIFAAIAFIWAPEQLFEAGWITCGRVPEGKACGMEYIGYRDITGWTLWPGVSLMVAHSLTGLAMQLPRMLAGLMQTIQGGADPADKVEGLAEVEVPASWFWIGLAVAGTFSIILQNTLFDIPPQYGALAVVLAMVLAFVAARSTGETDITPVGAMGKVTQLVFGGVLRGKIVPNLMAASVTGGAASQVGDMLTDMKTGYLLGAKPRLQVVAQVAGIFVGAVFAAIAYFLLVDPETLGGTEWPAPAAVIWAKVAELLSGGLENIEDHKLLAIKIAGAVGAAMAIIEKFLKPSVLRFMPSVAGAGVAVMVPFLYSFNMFIGAVIAWVVTKVDDKWAHRFLIVVASGLIAGETLMGVFIKAYEVISGLF